MPLKPSYIWPNEKSYPSLEEINRYIAGKLSRAETLTFEKQMANSRLLSDAVEGLLLGKAKNETAINEINSQIENKAKPKAKVIPFFNFTHLSIAASILIVFTGSLLFYIFRNQNTKTEIASAEKTTISDSADLYSGNEVLESQPDNEIALAEPKQQPSKLALKPPIVANDYLEEESINNQPVREKRTSAAPIVDEMRATVEVASESDNSLANAGPSLADTNKIQALADEMLAFANHIKLEEDSEDIGYGTSKKADQAPSSSQNKELSERRISKAKKSASTAHGEDQKREAKPSGQSIKPSLKTAEAMISQNKYDKAIEELNAIIQQNDFEKEKAFWLKAACLIKLDKANEAKLILRELRNTKGQYASQASKMLEKLE